MVGKMLAKAICTVFFQSNGSVAKRLYITVTSHRRQDISKQTKLTQAS